VNDPVTVDDSYAQRFAELASAREAKAKSAAYYDDLKASLLADMGFDPDDDRPQPCTAVDSENRPLFRVDVSYRKGFDKKGFESTHPALFAQFETLSPVKTIKPVE
jgi:hypothetical protein